MTKNRIVLILGIVIVLAIIFLFFQNYNQTGLFSLNQTNQLTINNSDLEPIKIGVVLPMSGKMAYYKDYIPPAMNIAVDEINSSGGINGRTIKVLYEDSAGDSTQSVTAFNKLVQIDEVKFVFTTVSNTIMSIAPESERQKIINFGIASASPNISTAGEYTFRHNLLPQDEAEYLADFIYNKQGYKKMAFMLVNAESGVSYGSFLKSEYEKLGGEVVSYDFYEKGATDYKILLSKIKESKVTAVFSGSYPNELGIILNQKEELGLNAQFFSVYPIEVQDLLNISKENANGLIYTQFYDPKMIPKEFDPFVQKYKTATGQEPNFYSALSYDSLRVLAEAMKHCENPEDTNCVKNELYKIQNFQGVTGNISFDLNGDTKKDVFIKTIKDEKFVIYEAS